MNFNPDQLDAAHNVAVLIVKVEEFEKRSREDLDQSIIVLGSLLRLPKSLDFFSALVTFCDSFMALLERGFERLAEVTPRQRLRCSNRTLNHALRIVLLCCIHHWKPSCLPFELSLPVVIADASEVPTGSPDVTFIQVWSLVQDELEWKLLNLIHASVSSLYVDLRPALVRDYHDHYLSGEHSEQMPSILDKYVQKRFPRHEEWIELFRSHLRLRTAHRPFFKESLFAVEGQVKTSVDLESDNAGSDESSGDESDSSYEKNSAYDKKEDGHNGSKKRRRDGKSGERKSERKGGRKGGSDGPQVSGQQSQPRTKTLTKRDIGSLRKLLPSSVALDNDAISYLCDVLVNLQKQIDVVCGRYCLRMTCNTAAQLSWLLVVLFGDDAEKLSRAQADAKMVAEKATAALRSRVVKAYAAAKAASEVASTAVQFAIENSSRVNKADAAEKAAVAEAAAAAAKSAKEVADAVYSALHQETDEEAAINLAEDEVFSRLLNETRLTLLYIPEENEVPVARPFGAYRFVSDLFGIRTVTQFGLFVFAITVGMRCFNYYPELCWSNLNLKGALTVVCKGLIVIIRALPPLEMTVATFFDDLESERQANESIFGAADDVDSYADAASMIIQLVKLADLHRVSRKVPVVDPDAMDDSADEEEKLIDVTVDCIINVSQPDEHIVFSSTDGAEPLKKHLVVSRRGDALQVEDARHVPYRTHVEGSHIHCRIGHRMTAHGGVFFMLQQGCDLQLLMDTLQRQIVSVFRAPVWDRRLSELLHSHKASLLNVVKATLTEPAVESGGPPLSVAAVPQSTFDAWWGHYSPRGTDLLPEDMTLPRVINGSLVFDNDRQIWVHHRTGDAVGARHEW